jgi:hypothetical protein
VELLGSCPVLAALPAKERPRAPTSAWKVTPAVWFVPQAQARIRVQISAAHDQADRERAVAACEEMGRAHHVI